MPSRYISVFAFVAVMVGSRYISYLLTTYRTSTTFLSQKAAQKACARMEFFLFLFFFSVGGLKIIIEFENNGRHQEHLERVRIKVGTKNLLQNA
jgi:hypothetical protein